MQVVVLIFSLFFILLFMFLQSLRIPQSRYSKFELERRRSMGDTQAQFGLRRLESFALIFSLQQVVSWVVLLIAAGLDFYRFGWAVGSLVLIMVVIVTGPISKLGILRRSSQLVYRKYEDALIGLVLNHKKLGYFLPGSAATDTEGFQPTSREELLHIIRDARKLVSSDEANLLEHSLTFFSRTVEAVMTPLSSVTTVEAGELLGPLILDDLHRTGHTLFPVTNGEEIVGMLDITDSVALRTHDSAAVSDIMRHDIVRIAETEPLDEALRIIIDSKQVYLLVTTDIGEVVGLVGIGDIVRALTGWRRH